MSIVITTPTGKVGSRVAERLLASGRPFTVVVRDPSKLSADVRAKATVVTGSLEAPGVLQRATVGADALFLLLPPNFTTDNPAEHSFSLARIAADAIRTNRVSRVVFLSSAGADRDDLAGVTRLGQVEKLLEAAAPNVTVLRAGFFYENLLSGVPTIADHGAFYLPFTATQPVAMVATRDIGDAAADTLLDATWSGHSVRPVVGPEDYTFTEIAQWIGAAIGQDVRYVTVDRDAVRGALLGAGASVAVADDLSTLYVGLATHADELGTRGTESSPTTMQEFVNTVLAPAINGLRAATLSR
jgi:uncharacterized protein YbjT (DUF2867 family)